MFYQPLYVNNVKNYLKWFESSIHLKFLKVIFLFAKVKQKVLTLAEMQTFLQKRMEDDEQLRKDIEHVFAEINL